MGDTQEAPVAVCDGCGTAVKPGTSLCKRCLRQLIDGEK
jgi:predicted amidophosphoribosyltransferase